MKFLGVLLRWLTAGWCLFVSVRQMMTALKIEGYAAAPHLFFGVGAFLVALLLISPETVVKFCEFCSRPLTHIVFPGARADRPPLSYRMARLYATQMRFADAAEEYQKIIRYYPREQAAYRELLTLARTVEHGRLYHKYERLYRKRFKTAPFDGETEPKRLASETAKTGRG